MFSLCSFIHASSILHQEKTEENRDKRKNRIKRILDLAWLLLILFSLADCSSCRELPVLGYGTDVAVAHTQPFFIIPQHWYNDTAVMRDKVLRG